MMNERISIRELIEFVFRSGDITSGLSGGIKANERALIGTRLHQKLQKQEMKRDTSYRKEVPLQILIEYPFGSVLAEGRADGIFTGSDGVSVIDEIKSTARDLSQIDLSTYPLHLAQAKCYAYLYLKDREEEKIRIRITYIHIETEEVLYLEKDFEKPEVVSFWDEVVRLYEPWVRFESEWREKRNQSLSSLTFPFPDFRPGQRAMAACVYRTIENSEMIFLKAPTGIGKTLSTLYPSLISMGEEKTGKIFYLTAKGVTKEAALQAAEILRDRSGMMAKTVVITAKDKICPLAERRCDPEICPFAKGHFDRVNNALYEAITQHDWLDDSVFLKISKSHQVCPFELSLDAALFSDLIICDYNYVFDPSASLKRFFAEGKTDHVLLIDEAHNLVDRAREMFSVDLSKEELLELRRVLGKESMLYQPISRVNRLFLEISKKIPDKTGILMKEEVGSDLEQALYYAILSLSDKMSEALEGEISPEAKELLLGTYFRVLSLMRTWDKLDPGYAVYFEKKNTDLVFHLSSIDPAVPLRAVFENVKSAVLFSATLTPADYFKRLLGGNEDTQAIGLPSPFPRENRKVLIAPLRMTYQVRRNQIPAICRLIYRMTEARSGHYLVFFPSFAFMEEVVEAYIDLYPLEKVMVQSREMDDKKRQEFLQAMRDKKSPVTAFCVLGGVFSEGIDLVGDQLIGTAIVTVGLPQVGTERNLIKEHLDHMEDETVRGHGFEFAYLYPGFGKILQAAGRVHRTSTDRGVILLIDERFTWPEYHRLFPEEYAETEIVDERTIREKLEQFWKGTV
ncbi:MAG: ATP-dependent DNA helicase [Firmicutes bacterium]|nr:ATP-dependent DNA helicase [Bacillota bacterium]